MTTRNVTNAMKNSKNSLSDTQKCDFVRDQTYKKIIQRMQYCNMTTNNATNAIQMIPKKILSDTQKTALP